jgi:hypothetical protein
MPFLATSASVLQLTLFIVALLLSAVYALRVRSGRLPRFRPLPGIDRLHAVFSEESETGRALHVATGAGRFSAAGIAAETFASLLIAQRVAEAITQRGGRVVATSGDLVSHAALRGTIHGAYRQAGFGADYQPSAIQLVAQETPVAYAAGVSARYAAEPMAASVVVGSYGAEALLISEEGRTCDIPQFTAATSLSALPVLTLSADTTLVGEELFAAEAYLSQSSSPKARLLTQDALRWTLLALLLVGLIWQLLALFQPGLGLPLLA